MQTLFSTTDVHPRNRFECWHDVACKIVVPHESVPECKHTFKAELQSGTLAEIELVLFENSPMVVRRTPRHCAQVRHDEIFVCRQGAGSLALEQAGRELMLEPGDMTLLDPLLPYIGRFSSGSKLLVLKVPRRALEARVGRTTDMVIRSIKPSEAEHSITSAFLAMLPAHTGRMGPAAEEIVKNQTLDLIAVSLAKMLNGHRPRVSSARSFALLNVRTAIETRLTDPALDGRTVAAAAGVSVRYANALLAQEGTSIARLIQSRRLARCRQALEDPSQGHRTISEIAYGWGFSDMTHFSRRFKAAYGVLPSECRRLAEQD